MEALKLETDEDGIPFIQVNNHILKIDLDDLDDYFMEKSVTELRETPENREHAMAELRHLIAENKHLHLPLEEPEFLLKFLRASKFYPDSAYKLASRYYTFLYKNRKLINELDDEKMKQVFINGVFEFLPVRAKGARILIINIKHWSAKEHSIAYIINGILMLTELACFETKTQVGGVHVILDCAGLNLGHIGQCTPWMAKIIVDYIQECLPIRLRAIHIVNQPMIFNVAYNIFKPLLNEKLKKKLHFHGQKWRSLTNIIPKDFVLTRYGGDLDIPTIPGNLFSEMFDFFHQFYDELKKYGYTPDSS